MAHLITVQNLLLALDHPFHLNRGHIHGDAHAQALPFVLEPLSLTSLAKYVVLESPSDDQMDKSTRAVMSKVRAILDEGHHLRLLRVGLIYAALYWLFLESNSPGSDWPFPWEWVKEFKTRYPGDFHLTDDDFIDSGKYEERAASSQEWGIYETNVHADSGEPREAALGTLRWIMAQGQGPNAIEKSHPPDRVCPVLVTAGSVFRRTPAAVVPTSDFVWDGRIWSWPLWCGGQEHQTLVGLTSLRTRYRPMLPKLNRRWALFVLMKIDEILAWDQRKETERDTRFVELGRYLCEVRAGQYWRLENLKSFDEFLERGFRNPGGRLTTMWIHEHLPPQARKELKVGWTKGLELAKVARTDGQEFDCATWLHKARSLPKDQFKREVGKELTGRETEPWEIIYFKLYKAQIPILEQAIETAALMLGSDKSRGYCLEMICADFLAGRELGQWQPGDLAEFDDPLLQVPARRATAAVPGLPGAESVISQMLAKRPRLRLDPQSYKELCEQAMKRDGRDGALAVPEHQRPTSKRLFRQIT